MLWSLFATREETRPHWPDGAEAHRILQPGPGQLVLEGLLWCDAHWRVCLEAILELGPDDQLTHVAIHLGDDASPALLGQPSARYFRRPDAWLCGFNVPRKTIEPPPVEPLLGEVRRWLAQNPDGQLVDPDWQTLDLPAAERLIRDRAATGHLLTLTPTWLDGRPAAWLA